MAKSLFEFLTVMLCSIIVIITFPVSVFFCLHVVNQYQRVIIFRLGRLKRQKPYGPGIVFLLPCVDTFNTLDLRLLTMDIDPQEILSKDQVTVGVDAIIYFRVFDPLLAVTKISNYEYSTELLGATILRNVLGTRELFDILTDRPTIAHAITSQLDEATDDWGIKVERVEIKNINLPYKLQRAMAAEAEASREAKAKVIAAEGELKASQMLKEASDIMTQSTVAVQLRYMQTLNTISAQRKSTVIFPIPIDIIPTKPSHK